MQDPKFLYEAALRLRNDPQLAPFKEWLFQQREVKRELLEASSPAITQIIQGEAQCLSRIMDLIESSPRVLEKRAGQQ